MFEILKNMFGKKDDNELAEIINDGAFLIYVRSPMEFA